jgi:hypothetical protein
MVLASRSQEQSIMQHWICSTCGTQFSASAQPPAHCPICEDERQYIGPAGQQWTTLAQLQATHRNEIHGEAAQLTGVGTTPGFAIAQRALLVQTPRGNVLWDCISLLDDATVAAVRERGGIKTIAISHPHYYSSMIEWSRAFDAPVYLHAADREWVMRPDPAIHFWDGDTCPLSDGLTLIRSGGHFAGATVLHWRDGADGRGVLLTGDIINVIPDRRYVSFMYSYPNQIPLNAVTVRRVAASVAPFAFEQIYGAWWDRVVPHDAYAAVQRSAERYIRAIAES